MGAEIDFAAGAYGPTEAARIIDIRAKRLRRWLDGERSLRSAERRPVLRDGRHPDTRLSLSFKDLVEALFVKGFLDAGLKMRVVHTVHKEARLEFNTAHPFAAKRFEHDGRTIIERVRRQDDSEVIVDRYTTNAMFTAVMLPLIKKLDYDRLTNEARRYFPLGIDRPVVIDPRRSFGEPTTARRGVPTRVLFGAFEAGDAPAAIARWYGVERDEVDTAIEYEQALGQRKAA